MRNSSKEKAGLFCGIFLFFFLRLLLAFLRLAKHRERVAVIGFGCFLGRGVKAHANRACQGGGVDDDTLSVGREYGGVLFGRELGFGHVGFVLVAQAAHQSATAARDLRGVDRKALLLGHLDGNLAKVLQVGRTAEGSAAHAKATDETRFVANTDLAKLDAGVEVTCKIVNELAEVHTSL